MNTNSAKLQPHHDDVIKRKHFPCYWLCVHGIHQSPVNSPHKGQWCGALMFSLICTWINGGVNDREDGDLRRHRAHYDVNVMISAETICSAHDMIWYAIWCTRYDTFRDTLIILNWEAEACDPGLRSEALHSTYYNCLRRNDAQWLQQWRSPQSFQMQCVCDEFTNFIGIYWLSSLVSRVRF